MKKPSDPSPGDPVARLLSRGLEHYGRNEIEDAIRCWREALEIDPRQLVARDYLESAGVACELAQEAEIIDFGAVRAQLTTNHPVEPVTESELPRVELEQLLRERRYEEALRLLYAARARRPTDAGIIRSIGLLRDRLIADYATRLGSLDGVPSVAPNVQHEALRSEERHVLSLVDGISSYDDIVAASAVGRLQTLRVLSTFLEWNVITAELPNTSGPPTTRSGTHPGPALNEPLTRGPVSETNVTSGNTSSASAVLEPAPTSAVLVAEKRPESASQDDGYRSLFRRATEAYLLRNFDLALELFGECHRLHPEDPRPQYNMKALKRRTNKA